MELNETNEVLKQEEVTELKQLSPQCQKAVRRFKAWLKVNAGEQCENVRVVAFCGYDECLGFTCTSLTNGLVPDNLQLCYLVKHPWKNKLHRVDAIFGDFCRTLDVSYEEYEQACQWMSTKSWFYLPKVKLVVSGRKKSTDESEKEVVLDNGPTTHSD